MIQISGKYGNKLSIIKSSLGADAVDSCVSALTPTYVAAAVPRAEGLTQAPGLHVASALAVLAVPSRVGRASQTLVVDEIKSTVAHASSVNKNLVGAANNNGRNGNGRTLRTVEDGSCRTFLTNSVDPVVTVNTHASGSVEEGVVTAGRSGGLALTNVGVVDIAGSAFGDGTGGGSADLAVPGGS